MEMKISKNNQWILEDIYYKTGSLKSAQSLVSNPKNKNCPLSYKNIWILTLIIYSHIIHFRNSPNYHDTYWMSTIISITTLDLLSLLNFSCCQLYRVLRVWLFSLCWLQSTVCWQLLQSVGNFWGLLGRSWAIILSLLGSVLFLRSPSLLF